MFFLTMLLALMMDRGQVLIDNDELIKPLSMVVAPKGELYLLDLDTRKVWCYDANGKLLFHFGDKGSGPGMFETPTDMTVVADGRVVVLDSTAQRMSLFDAKGKFIKQIHLNLAGIGNVTPLADGKLLVSKSNGSSIQFSLEKTKEVLPRFQIIDLTGQVVGKLGELTRNENPLLEANLNTGYVAVSGERVYFAGRITPEWVVYEHGKATVGTYKPGFVPVEPKAEMQQVKQADGSISFKLRATMDIVCLGLVAVNERELVMLRPIKASDDELPSSRLVVVDPSGKQLREDQELFTAQALAIAAKRDKIYVLTETEDGGYQVIARKLP